MEPDLPAEIEEATKQHQVIERDESNRETYRLASLIVDKFDPGKSINQLEKLGEEKLKWIVQWLKETQ
jgi:hypothetical protein